MLNFKVICVTNFCKSVFTHEKYLSDKYLGFADNIVQKLPKICSEFFTYDIHNLKEISDRIKLGQNFFKLAFFWS